MGEPAVSVQDLAGGYGARTLWASASFEVAPGQFVAVLGPNGAGKSTLVKILLGVLAPRAGRVSVLGKPPRRGNAAIGYVPQERRLAPDLPLRGWDLVALGVDGHRWGTGVPARHGRTREAIAAAIDAVGAAGYADRRVGTLSGGERQRLLLAQALVRGPRLLLLDEPLANLDVRNQATIARLVAKVAKERNMTTLLVAHDINPLLPVVDRVLYVARGGVAVGTPDEIIQPEALSRLYETPVEVLTDRHGRVFVVGLEAESTHPHG